jgi:predicted DNA-binding transcriptional regulator AlpA
MNKKNNIPANDNDPYLPQPTSRCRGDVLPISLAPRGLSRAQAAAYIGISPSLFDKLVADGRMPKPIRINSRTIWDRTKLDESFQTLLDADSGENPWDALAA